MKTVLTQLILCLSIMLFSVSLVSAQIEGGSSEIKSAYEVELEQLKEIEPVTSPNIDSQAQKHYQSKNFVLGTFLLLCTAITALVFISFVLMRGLSKIVDLQHKSFDLAAKERKLKEQEKIIIATILDAEIRENKEKIEAYLMVYEETFKDFTNSGQKPKYQESGDIIQKQPSLSRSVFDGNTHRLEIVGEQLASDLVHYYARIKTIPEYVDLEPDTPLLEARKLIETCVENARKLGELSDNISEKFVSYALIKQKNYE
ncbi:MAG: hypothetical protein OEY94_00665 [Alphaproteobacteria bacterium]|nr:hypothetical protein [Alphaproteobacteria bacterium]